MTLKSPSSRRAKRFGLRFRVHLRRILLSRSLTGPSRTSFVLRRNEAIRLGPLPANTHRRVIRLMHFRA